MRILLVEDEPTLQAQLLQALRQAGHTVECAGDGATAQYLGEVEEFDAVVLDLGLPVRDGLTVLRAWREAGRTMPVLILTARDSLIERVGTLNQGADDFLAKPFDLAELEARLHALIRRARGSAHWRQGCGPLTGDVATRGFTLNDEPLTLTPREHAVLRVLIQHVGEPLSKSEILDRVVSDERDINPEAIEVLVHRLRKRLAGSAVRISTLRGLGYVLESGP